MKKSSCIFMCLRRPIRLKTRQKEPVKSPEVSSRFAPVIPPHPPGTGAVRLLSRDVAPVEMRGRTGYPLVN